jgi:hypothetical protein
MVNALFGHDPFPCDRHKLLCRNDLQVFVEHENMLMLISYLSAVDFLIPAKFARLPAAPADTMTRQQDCQECARPRQVDNSAIVVP